MEEGQGYVQGSLHGGNGLCVLVISVSLFFFLCLWFCLGAFFLPVPFFFFLYFCLFGFLFVLWRRAEFSVPETPCADPMWRWLCKLSVVSFSLLGVASFQTEASGGLALPVADAFEYKGVFKAQRKELIMLHLQCLAITLWDFCISYSGKWSPRTAAAGFKNSFVLPEIITLFALLLHQLSQTSNRLVVILLIKQFLDEGFPGWSLDPWVPDRCLCLCMESLVIDFRGHHPASLLWHESWKEQFSSTTLQMLKCRVSF